MTIWTPGGEHEPRDEAPQLTDEEQAAYEEFLRTREQLRQTPVSDLVANHAIGLWQLALIHLAIGPDEDSEPNLEQAQLAIDAMAALVEGLPGRLGGHEAALVEALTNLRLAFVEVSGRTQSSELGPEKPE